MAYMKRNNRSGVSPARLILLLSCLVPMAPAQLNQNCVVSVLNRTVNVKTDGTWVLPNIPANFGPVRARATCVQNGVTTFGQSALFNIGPNSSTDIPPIVLGPTSPIPTSVAITAGSSVLNSVGATLQLTVTGTYLGGSTSNLTAGSSGTQYKVSNPAIATVSADGLVTAVRSGTAIVQAVNEGSQGLFNVRVVLSNVDSDHDGIPDDAEIRLGLNPRDPTDALLDFDHDGLTNLREYQLGTDLRRADTDGDGLTDGQEVLIYHTNPLVADSDGDSIPDGLEVSLGTDPNDPRSVNYTRAISSLEVRPSSFVINVNSLNPLASQQLTVIAHLTNGGTADLTSTVKGTTYTSSDLTICTIGTPDGTVYAGNPGACTITVKFQGLTGISAGVINNFTPASLSVVSIPGFMNGIDVNGDYAYVAAGSAGLQVVSVSDRNNPVVVGSLSLAGNANDVKLMGNTAFVATGAAGLAAVNITNPLAPALLGTFSTGDTALGVTVRGSTAYVSNTSNLVLVNVANPSSMSQISALTIPGGSVRGSDVDETRKLAVVASGSSVYVVDLATPSAPVLKGSAVTGDARDVAIGGNYVFVADYVNSMTSVDISNPAAPVVKSHILDPNVGGYLQDVVLSGNFAIGADVKFVNGVPFTDISDPTNLISRSVLNFTQRDDNGMALAADSNFVYLVTDHNQLNKYGSTGDGRLYIGQFRPRTDLLGIPPTVSITAPLNNATVVQGSTLLISVNATDDIAVAAVNFTVNGQIVFTKTSAPYQYSFQVPTTGNTLTLGATAVDLGSNIGTAANVAITLIPDPLTTVTGRVIDKTGTPVPGATVSFGTLTATAGGDGTFTLPNVPTAQGNIAILASGTVAGRVFRGRSASTVPVPSGVTVVGDIRLSGGKIGLIHCDSTAALRNALVGTHTIDVADLTDINACSSTPTLTSLSDFGAVIVWSNNSLYQPDALGNILADFVDQGGGVLLATYTLSQSWRIGGRILNSGYSPFLVSSATQSTAGRLDLTRSNTNHPIMAGVTNATYFQNSNYTNPPLNTGATLIAVDTSGNRVVAISQSNRVVGISIYPGYGDMGTLFANALNFIR